MLKQYLTKLIAVATIAAASAAITAGCGGEGDDQTGAEPETEGMPTPPEDGSGAPGTEDMPGETPNPTG